MNGGTIAFIMAGLIGFGGGAYLASAGQREVGIAMMAMGLMFQVLALRQLRMAKKKELNDAG